MTRRARITTAILSAAVALAVVPASAAAADYVVRPANTTDGGSWLRAGFGEPHELLDDDVLQPSSPYLFWDYLYASGNGTLTTEVGFAALAIPSTETITSASAWTYVAAGSGRAVTLELRSGQTVLATLVVPAGEAGWRSLAPSALPTAAELADLRVRATVSGSGATSASFLVAAYAVVATDAPATDTSGTQTGSSTPDVTDPAPGTDTVTTPDPGVPAPIALSVRSLPLAASGILSVPVTCQLPTGCTGTVTTELVNSRASTARRRKTRAKRFRLKPGQSKKVPVRLDRRSARVVRRKGRARVRVKIAVDGAPAVAKEVTVRERRRATRNRSTARTPRRAPSRTRGGKRGSRRGR